MLRDLPLASEAGPMPRLPAELAAEGLRRAKAIECFDFVPSNCCVVYAVLSALPRARLCEWGSGMGVVTGLAQTLGFDARGIEIDPRLAAESRRLLADFGLAPKITTGDYLQLNCPVDIYFTYCWPGQMSRVEERFAVIAPDHARLLICHGAEDIRCRVKE
jgi:hypothetical protein